MQAPRFTVIWLHGLGADGNDFVPVVEAMNLPDSAAIRFVFPHAPVQPVTINGGYEMRSWYDIVQPDLAVAPDFAGINVSVETINELLDGEIARGVAEENILLAGFSQGGLIALACGLARPIRGIVALSTYLPNLLYPAKVSLPIFVGHGEQDPIVPVEQSRLLNKKLRNLGCDVTLRHYRMEHSINAEEILDIKQWLLALLSD